LFMQLITRPRLPRRMPKIMAIKQKPQQSKTRY
jgi:hypothetical protein